MNQPTVGATGHDTAIFFFIDCARPTTPLEAVCVVIRFFWQYPPVGDVDDERDRVIAEIGKAIDAGHRLIFVRDEQGTRFQTADGSISIPVQAGDFSPDFLTCLFSPTSVCANGRVLWSRSR